MYPPVRWLVLAGESYPFSTAGPIDPKAWSRADHGGACASFLICGTYPWSIENPAQSIIYRGSVPVVHVKFGLDIRIQRVRVTVSVGAPLERF